MGLASLVLLHLVVRVDAGAHIKPEAVARVVAEARSVWKPYAVDIAATSSTAAVVPDRLDGSAVEELTLNITDRVPVTGQWKTGDPFGLGWIEFAGSRPLNIINVSTSAAANLVNKARWAGRAVDLLPDTVREQLTVRALGLAVAHEIGHYLLRSTAHTRGGLMRAQFSANAIGEKAAGFRLEPGQVELLQRRSRDAGGLQAKLDVPTASPAHEDARETPGSM